MTKTQEVNKGPATCDKTTATQQMAINEANINLKIFTDPNSEI